MTLTTLRLSNSNRQVSMRASGAGEPVVLIHGVGMQSAAWTPQIEALTKTYRIIALDMPGHGQSDPLSKDSTLSDFVAWCADVLNTLTLGPVNLAGHSMGALIASGTTIDHPNLIKRVALLNGVFCRDAAAREAVIARAETIQAGQVDLETPLARWFSSSLSDQAARSKVSDWLSAVDLNGYATAYFAFAKGDAVYADRFADITCPFLALTADGDPNSTPAMSQAMAAQVQNGRAVTIQGHRHMVNLTAPQAVTEHLSVWLKQRVETPKVPA